MKLALLLVAAGILGASAVFVALVLMGSRKQIVQCPDYPPDPGAERVGSDAALERVAAFARQDPEFGRVWDLHVRNAADELTAQIAGRHMAGECGGEIEWIAHVPTPESMHEEDAHEAFRLAVCAEVTARVNAMTGPGAFG
jgi:hypothetical protein